MRTLIHGGTLVTATDSFQGDLLIDGETVAAVGAGIAAGMAATAGRLIDARGKLVIPGGVDAHTHLDMPLGAITSADDFESGTIAAAFGGTTTVLDYATQSRGKSLRHALDIWMAKARGRAVVDYGFHMIVCDPTPSLEQEMAALVKDGVPSFKLFMAYPGTLMVDDATLFRALLAARDQGALVAIHAENGGVIDVLVRRALAQGNRSPRFHAATRPARAEAEATHRAAALAEMADARVYIVHLSAPEALEEVERARARGVQVHAETCPQYLFLSDEEYDRPGFEGAAYVMSPPLRRKGSDQALWSGLARGTIDTVATDHCPFSMVPAKELGVHDFSKIPNGAPGIETRMSLLFDGGVRSGRITLQRFVEITSTAPARIFGLFPRKGSLSPGADADVVIFDPARRRTLSAKSLHMRVDHNPYEGREVVGAADTVLVRGTPVIEEGRFVGRPGQGAFLRREPRA